MASNSTAPLKVDAETDALISHGAHFLHLTKKDLVAQAVRDFVEAQRTEIEKGVREAAALLDGSHVAKVALLSGLSKDEIEELGGVRS
ncbi:MAG TPA: hypothetical protein VM142_04960 [Acidimicrobiales bacterium]|nr:hypothetical protein [Acidimicrobiales bacterium]